MRPKQRLSFWGVSWTSAGLFASDVVLYYLAFYRAKLGRFCGRFFAGCCFGASWVPARALGECCGIRIRVRGSGSCFGSAAATVAGAGWIRCGDLRVVNLVDLRQLLRGVLPKDLRQLRPWGPLRGSECGRDLRRGSGCPGRLRAFLGTSVGPG